jgi:hypothetical protein
MDFLKKPIFIGAIAVLLVIIVIWSFVSNKNAANNTPTDQTSTSGDTAVSTTSDLTTVDPSDFDEVAKGELLAATKYAVEFNPEFKISVVEVQIGATLQKESIVSRYAFSTTKDVRNNWIYTTDQSNGSFLRALIPKADYLGDIVPINMTLWKSNYIAALQLADKNGGSDWRSKNTLQSITATLKESADLKKLYWTLEYKGSDSSYVAVIDATTLQISQQ